MSTPARSTAGRRSRAKRRTSCGARHRDHLDRQREGAEHVDQLALVGDADEALGEVGDDLLARQRGAAALDHAAAPVDLVGAVDVDRQPLDLGWPRAPRMPCARSRSVLALELDTAPAMRSRMRRQRVDEVVDRRAGADADRAGPGTT